MRNFATCVKPDARYVGLFEAGMNFTRTAHAGGGSVFALAIAVAIVVRRRAKTPAWSACTLSMYRATMFIVRNKTMRQPGSLPAHRLY
ncbi:hypothetical protein BLAC_06475 [Bifidobacterium animalis subsp. lactis ATCC 27673]|nr:hypothetical protein BLAC_06475 [Bifidobacterium animalis subsp. lactis ATCC 27673]